jgi:putative sigma-54 modulation protein
MQIQMTGHGTSISPALRELTEKKFQRLCTHYAAIDHVKITFSVEKIRQDAHAHITLPGATIDAHAESDDMYTTVDLLLKKLDIQLAKYKDKHTN